jgi:hypothetical protein
MKTGHFHFARERTFLLCVDKIFILKYYLFPKSEFLNHYIYNSNYIVKNKINLKYIFEKNTETVRYNDLVSGF